MPRLPGLPATRIPVGAGRFYLSLTCQEAADLQFSALQRLFPGDVEQLRLPGTVAERYIGSELVVAPQAIAQAIDTLWKRLYLQVSTGRRSVANLANALNAHSMWMAALTRLVAFVRPVVDPLPRSGDFDPARGFAVVCDKREKASGWPTQNDDFVLARRLLSDGDTGTCRLQALTDAFGSPSQPDAIHRAVLCFLVIHAAEAGSAPTPGGR